MEIIRFLRNYMQLLEHFFDNLQDKMTSTVTTVMGTAEKLKIRVEEEEKVTRGMKKGSEHSIS